jgi:hypothetical protein
MRPLRLAPNMKPIIRIALLAAFLFSLGSSAEAQINNYGSFTTALGQVNGNIYNAMSRQIQYMDMMRAKKRPSTARSAPAQTPPPRSGAIVSPSAPKYYGKFRPNPRASSISTIVDTLGETAEEKALLKQVIGSVKATFEKEAAAKGWNNNVAGAMTFFLAATVTIYHDSAEPSDATAASIYDAVNRAIDEVPEFGRASDTDKQQIYETLIAFGAIPLATYTEGKQNGSAETVESARKLAGELIRIVLKTDPETIHF